jgi:hypothetical protein
MLGMTLLSTLARAEPSPALDRVSVWVGAYDIDFNARVDVVDPANGVDAQDQPLLSGSKRIGRARADVLLMDSQGISVDYFRIQQQREQSISRNITANGQTYGVGGTVGHDTSMEVGNFSYRFWMGEGAQVFGLGLGAQYYAIQTRLYASASVGGVGSFDQVTEEKRDGWAPLLTLGWRARLNEQWRVYADASGARHSKNGQSGSIVNGALGVEYFPLAHVGIGAEYGVGRIRYKREEGDQVARLNVKMDGPAVFLRLRF